MRTTDRHAAAGRGPRVFLDAAKWGRYPKIVNLEAFGVKNLRCLRDTGFVPIRPITVLVGRNSSGKSTFLRAFPLLRQSVETARNSPILWYHERYVDFGSLQDAANHGLKEPEVTFQFRVRLSDRAAIVIGEPTVDVSVTLAGGDVPYIREYEIAIEGHVIRWELGEDGRLKELVANGERIEPEAPLSLGGRAYLMPSLHDEPVERVTFQQAPEPTWPFLKYGFAIGAQDRLVGPLIEHLKPLFHGNTSSQTIADAAWKLRLGGRAAIQVELGLLSEQASFRQKLGSFQPGHPHFEALVSAIAAFRSPSLVDAVDIELALMMSRVAYLKPLRVNPERAYRIQNLSVDEVDPDGKNLPMFLRSLNEKEAESFAEFSRTTLGFETTVKTVGHHAEVLVKESPSSRFVNLVDVGFGFSEVLPLAAVLWSACVRPNTAPTPLVVLEQPELHLHPAAQSKLAGMLAASVKGGLSKVIVETHSESLINGLGKAIHDGVLKADDVQIVLFDKDQESGESDVRLAGYREDGSLRDWPYGFLSPVAERRVRPAAE